MMCPRQAWLKEQVAGDTNDKAVLGQLLHELLQSCLERALPRPAGDGLETRQQQRREGEVLTEEWALKEARGTRLCSPH